MKSGIYKYTNKINGKIYIGSAVNLIKRHWEHLNYPAKSAKLLQLAFTKYGKENFNYEILEYCPKYLLYKIEQSWINWYKCYERPFGYNLSKFAEGSREGCTKESARKGVNTKILKGFDKNTYPKLSESKIGKLNPMYGKSGELNKTSKKIYVYNKEGLFINDFPSLKIAGEILNIGKIKMNRKSYRGYRFSYIKLDKLDSYKNNKIKQIIITKNNENLIFNSVKETSEFLNVNNSSIVKAIKDNFKCKSYKINYYNGKV